MIKLLHIYPLELVNRLRKLYYSLLFKSLGKNTRILGALKVYSPECIEIGDFCTLNHGVVLNGAGNLKIGDYCQISPYVIINTAGLNLNEPDYKKRINHHKKASVVLEDGVWLASNAIINPGVVIGEGAVVGAGAVVTKNVLKNAKVAGVPARVL